MIVIEYRKGSAAKQKPGLLKKYPGATIIDVTTNSPINEFAQLDPCYPIGRVPIPYSPDVTSESILGAMLGLAVADEIALKYRFFGERKIIGLKRAQNSCFPSKNKETKGINSAKLQIKGFKRGVYGKSMLGWVEARHIMYIPTYIWMLENRARKQVNKIKHLSQKGIVVLLDNKTNEDVNDITKPLSHAYIIKSYLEDAIPQNQGYDNLFATPRIEDDKPEHPLKDAKIGDLVSISGKKGEVVGIEGLAFTVQFKDAVRKFSINDTDINIITEEDINSATWNSSEWSKSFEECNAEKNPTDARTNVFDSTVEIVNKREYVTDKGKTVQLERYLSKDVASDSIYYDSELPQISNAEKIDTIISDESEYLLSFTKAQCKKDSTDDICIIHFADKCKPGGHVENGANTTEAFLCRCSDYYRYLFRYAKSIPEKKDYWVQPHREKHYPLDIRYGGVFSHGVTVFRQGELHGYSLRAKPWKINIVAVPATVVKPRKTVLYNDGTIRGKGKLQRTVLDSFVDLYIGDEKYNEKVAIETVKCNIRTALRIAYFNNQRRLIVAPYKNSVRKIFKEVLKEAEFIRVFRDVFFISDIEPRKKRTKPLSEASDNLTVSNNYNRRSDDGPHSKEFYQKKYPRNFWETYGLIGFYCDKWFLRILYFMERNASNPIRFVDIQKRAGVLSKKLAEVLPKMTEDGLIHNDKPKSNKSNYSLTERGRSLLEVLKPLVIWIESNPMGQMDSYEIVGQYFDQKVISVLYFMGENSQVPLSNKKIKEGVIYYSDKEPSGRKFPETTLWRTLLIMEDEGLIMKCPEYTLTERGKSLLEVLHPLEQWIEDNNHSIKAGRIEFHEKQEQKKKRKQQKKWQETRKMKAAAKASKKR